MKITRFVIFLFLFSGCAYHFGASKRQLPGGGKTIYVTMFENRTQEEVGIEVDFTDAFVQALARSGVAEVKNSASADLTMKGVVHNVGYLGKTPNANLPDRFQNTATLFTEYQTTVTIILKIYDKNNKEVWQGQFLGEKNYKAPQLTTPGVRTANPLYNQSARRQTIRAIAKEVASEAVGQLTEGF